MYRQHHPDDPGMHQSGDAYTRVNYRRNPTFCERVQKSLVTFVIGILLIGGSVIVTFMNEGRAVQTAKSLAEGLQLAIPLKTTEVAFEQNNNKLVHMTGPLRVDKVLFDEEYGVAAECVHLRRKVEVYQWVEHSTTKEVREGENTRSETSYTYAQEWKSTIIQSSSFSIPTNHHNPTEFPVLPVSQTAKEISIGNFFLSQAMINSIGNFKKLHVNELSKPSGALLHQGMVYHGKDPFHPQIGDARVSFEYAGYAGKDSSLGTADIVSVIGRQNGNQLTSYETEAGDALEILYMGEHTIEEIFTREQATNSMLTWVVRVGGWFLMFIGFGCLTNIITTLVDWIPIVRELVGLGMMTLNFTLSMSLSLTVIALGWIRYRPWLGFTILALSTVPFIINMFRARRRRNFFNSRSYID